MHSSSDRSDRSARSGAARHREIRMPSEVSDDVGVFDRFAGWASHLASRAPFFAVCVLIVVLWVPSYFVFDDVDTWQLLINTTTTIITFLLVTLLQNSQYRSDEAVQHKLNAIAQALAGLVEHQADPDDASRQAVLVDVAELRDAVGLESRETS